jgi:hypothetical protein
MGYSLYLSVLQRSSDNWRLDLVFRYAVFLQIRTSYENRWDGAEDSGSCGTNP